MRKLFLPVLVFFSLYLSLVPSLAQEDVINLSISCKCGDAENAWFSNFIIPTFVAQQAEKGKTVSVELIDYDFNDEQFREQIALDFSLDTGTDIASFDGFWIPEFARDGLIKPLNEVVGPEVDEWDGWERINVQSNVSYNGQRYGIPSGTDVRMIFYRKDFFEAAGISLPWQPTSWQDIITTAQTLKDSGIEFPLQVDAGTYMGEATTMQGYFMLLLGAGAHIYDFEQQKWVIDEAAHLNVLNFYHQIYVDAALGNTELQLSETGRDDSFAAMHNGNIAMYIEGDWMWRDVMSPNNENTGISDRDELIGWAKMPAMEPGQGYNGQDFVTISGGVGYVLNPQTSHPQESWELMQLMASREAAQDLQNYTINVTARTDVEITGDPILSEMASTLLPLTTTRPLLPEYPLVSYEMQWMTEQVITGEASPEEALAAFEENVTEIVGADNLVIVPAE